MSIIDIEAREALCQKGLLRSDRTADGTLVIYTYTDKCVFEDAWDEYSRNSRGHIFNTETGECAARPFPKFFNVGERGSSVPQNLDWLGHYEVYEKVDGWLGVLYRHQGQYKVASRGSFNSHGAKWATEYIQSKRIVNLSDDVTVCFEIVNPAQRIILDYGESELIVLAAFNRHTGFEYSRAQVCAFCEDAGLRPVAMHRKMAFQELMHEQKTLEGEEGFVIRFDDGTRVKVKTDWYMKRAKILANLTPIAVWEQMKDGIVSQEYMQSIPEEIRPLAEKYAHILLKKYWAIFTEASAYANAVVRKFNYNRKEIALHLQSEGKAKLGIKFGVTFAVLDGKSFDKLVMDAIYPKNNDLESA